jgi:hypothetical protein
MAGKLSPAAAVRIAELESYAPRVGRLHSLIEQYAAEKGNADNWNQQIKRLAGDLKLALMTAGLESLSQICGAIVLTASRSGNQGTKARALRESMGSLKFQFELAVRTVIREDELSKRDKHV